MATTLPCRTHEDTMIFPTALPQMQLGRVVAPSSHDPSPLYLGQLVLLDSIVAFDGLASIAVGVLLGGVAIRLVNMNKRFLLGQSVDDGEQHDWFVCTVGSFFLTFRSHSISFTGAHGFPKYKIGLRGFR
jgi:hypothetical protein